MAEAAVAEPVPLPAGPRPGRRAESPAGQRERSAGALRGPGPEITISIGHIEVRAAPAVAEPQVRPRFRPQVSLADFLSQDRRP